MNRLIVLPVLLWMLFSSSVCWSATVTVQDGDLIDYVPADQYVFDLMFTGVGSTQLSVGFILDPTEAFDITVSFQPDRFLVAEVSTEEDGAGTKIYDDVGIADPAVYDSTSNDLVFSSTTFYIDGSTFSTQWITLTDLFGPLTPVPVPTAAWLFGSGFIALIGAARRKRT